MELILKPDILHIIPSSNIKWIQDIVSSLGYYACGIDPTMLVTLKNITCKQTKDTEINQK